MNIFEMQIEDDIDLVFNVVVCANKEEFGEWEPEKPDGVASFIPNQDATEGINKLGTLVFLQGNIEDKVILYQSSITALFYAEVLTSLADISDEEMPVFFRSQAAQALTITVGKLKEILKNYYNSIT
jgi:hypothetical protein